MDALQNADTFTRIEELSELFRSYFDLDRDFVNSHHRSDLSFTNWDDCAFAALELTSDGLTSVTDLDLKLSVIAHSFHDCLIFQDVPLVYIWAVSSTLVSNTHVKLE